MGDPLLSFPNIYSFNTAKLRREQKKQQSRLATYICAPKAKKLCTKCVCWSFVGVGVL